MNWPAGVYWSLGYQRLAFVKSNTLFWAQRSNVLRKSGKEYHAETFFFKGVIGGRFQRHWLKPLQQICALDRKQILIFISHTILFSPPLASACVTCVTFIEITFLSSRELVLFQVVSNQKKSLQLIKVHHHWGCWGIWQLSSRLDRLDLFLGRG